MQQNCRILFVANGKHGAERCILTQSKKNCTKNILGGRGGCRIYVDGCTLQNNYGMRMRIDKIVRYHLCALSQWFLMPFPRRMVLATELRLQKLKH